MKSGKIYNPQFEWSREEASYRLSESEISGFLGRTPSNAEYIYGGVANAAYRIDEEWFLKATATQQGGFAVERSFSDVRWKKFRGPHVLSHSDRHLLTQWEALNEVDGTSSDGFKLGAAVGEIHSCCETICDDENEFLVSIFSSSETFLEAASLTGAAISEAKPPLWHEIGGDRIITTLQASLESETARWEEAFADKVRLHGDLKPGNLKKTSASIFIYDAAFSFVGPRGADLAHLFRHGLPMNFVHGFAEGYKSMTNLDPVEVVRKHRFLDYANVFGQLLKAKPNSTREKQTASVAVGLLKHVPN